MAERIVSIVAADLGWTAVFEAPRAEVHAPVACWGLVEDESTLVRRVVGLVDATSLGQVGVVPAEPNPRFLRYWHKSYPYPVSNTI